jgi:endonuclease YncB( thermonuclease family)
MVELVQGEMVVCNLTRKHSHGRGVGWCYRDGQDVAEALIRAGLALDCPRHSAGRYAAVETAAAARLQFPSTAGQWRRGG